MRAIIACAALGTRMRRFGMDHRPHGSDLDTGLPPLATGSQHSGSDLREGSRIRGVLAGDEQVTTPANRAATGIETVLFQNPCRNGTRERLIFQRPIRATLGLLERLVSGMPGFASPRPALPVALSTAQGFA